MALIVNFSILSRKAKRWWNLGISFTHTYTYTYTDTYAHIRTHTQTHTPFDV